MNNLYQNLCSSSVAKAKNSGLKYKTCQESRLEIPVISNGYEFANVASFETVADWKTAISERSLIPLYEAYELADASTERTLYETGNYTKVIDKGVEKITYENYISPQGYAVLKSIEDDEAYRTMFEFNEDNDYSGIYANDGVKVKGRVIKSFVVTKSRATKDKLPFVKVEITFDDRDDILSQVLTKSDLRKDNLEGIHDVVLSQVSASATSIKFKANFLGTKLTCDSFADANIVLKDVSGSAYAHSFVAPVDGVYELTGTGFLTDFTIEVNGVVVQSNIMLAGNNALNVSI